MHGDERRLDRPKRIWSRLRHRHLVQECVPEDEAVNPEEVPPEVGVDPGSAADMVLCEEQRQVPVKERESLPDRALAYTSPLVKHACAGQAQQLSWGILATA